ncbi:hypothetical protein [Burkholderia glumae]|uniref:hypothetical protein n=1 Tax=Burkholderia glumae TaxID=337 RepID=UPI00214A775F|nr:hypothetical protein [Burkholderia glumae]MCR1769778.1 hypothetical protein [Burkholderia glumae]UVT00073.1 hypothetical protein EFP19_30960 [Burkholderia glumae]
MKPSVFQALVIALLLLLLGLVTTLIVEVAPMRNELHAVAIQLQARAAADAREDAVVHAATQQLVDQARERRRSEQAPAPAFHIIPDH